MKRLPVNDPEFLPPAEAAWLEGIASSLPDPCRIVEVGTGKGNSFTAMAYGLALHDGWHIDSVDVGECAEGRQRIVDAQVPPSRYTVTRTTSIAFESRYWQRVDMVYVDGDHRYEGVSADICAWALHVKVGGIMAFDDYCDVHPGVVRAIDEWMTAPKWRLFGQVGRLVAFERVE